MVSVIYVIVIINTQYSIINIQYSIQLQYTQVNNLKEIEALRALSPHPNIVNLQDVLFDPHTHTLGIVFELMEKNLYDLISGKNQDTVQFVSVILVTMVILFVTCFLHAKSFSRCDPYSSCEQL